MRWTTTISRIWAAIDRFLTFHSDEWEFWNGWGKHTLANGIKMSGPLMRQRDRSGRWTYREMTWDEHNDRYGF